MRFRVLRRIVLVAMLCMPATLTAQQQSAIIRGVVVGVDGQPAVGATVTLVDRLGSIVAATQTEASGRFRLDDVAPGTYTVLAEAPLQRSDARLVAVQAALPIDLELRLATRMTESVTVQGADEAPPVTTRMTIAGDALRQVPARLSSRGMQQVLATLPGSPSPTATRRKPPRSVTVPSGSRWRLPSASTIAPVDPSGRSTPRTACGRPIASPWSSACVSIARACSFRRRSGALASVWRTTGRTLQGHCAPR